MTETPPILFLIFNRPDLTARVFERIREARPLQLFVAADGPRTDRKGEPGLCAVTRQVVDEGVDWPCEVKTLYRDRNLGCMSAVSSAITWFFEHVEEGIILEDDCVPHLTFFPYCMELLERYRHDTRIAAINAENPAPASISHPVSYGFTVYPLPWAWATWARAWRNYDPKSINGSEKHLEWLAKWFGSYQAAEYWVGQFLAVESGSGNIWDYRFMKSCWQANALAVIPSVNLVTNIGFDERSTHCMEPMPGLSNEALPMPFPLQHPGKVSRDYALDATLAVRRFGIRPAITRFEEYGRHVDLFVPTIHRQLERLHPARISTKLKKMIRSVLSRMRSLASPDPDRFLKHLSGVIHIGANAGQERDLYAKHNLEVIWVEPLPDIFEQLKSNIAPYPKQKAFCHLVTDQNGHEYTFHVANNGGQSSSILDFKDHTDIWPEVYYTGKMVLRSITLPQLMLKEQIDPERYQGLVLDTQGAELLVLRGCESMLSRFKYIKAEVADFESYEGCCTEKGLTVFMNAHGFELFSREEFAKRNAGGSYYDNVYRKRRG